MRPRPMFRVDADALERWFVDAAPVVVRLGFADAVDMPGKPRTATMLLDHLDGLGMHRPAEWRRLDSRKIRQIYGAAYDAARMHEGLVK